VTLQLIRDPTNARGFLSARSVTGFLSDLYRTAADEVGKIFLIADDRVNIFEMVVTFAVASKLSSLEIYDSVISDPRSCI